MAENNKNEELQSRREFFKKAAKGVLPILGAMVLAGSPSIVRAAEHTLNGCNDGCHGMCKTNCTGCEGTCSGGCTAGCKGGCRGTCHTMCTSRSRSF